MSTNIVITGAGGYLGTRLVSELISKTDAVIFAIVRDKWSPHSSKLINLKPGRVHLVSGDVCVPKVARISTLPRIDEFWHLAGSTDFHRKDLATSVNEVGTANAVNLAKGLNVKTFFHVSTAYVAGSHQGVVAEDVMVEHPRFRNVYEKSKYKGERIVRGSDLPFIIMRPSIIMGDSVTGEAKSDKMVYGVVKLCERALRILQREFGGDIPSNIRYFLKGNREATKNLITIDDVVDLMLSVREKGRTGLTYHLCNPHSTTIGEIHSSVQHALGINFLTVAFDYPDNHDIRQKMIDRGIRVYEPYTMISDPVFDMANTRSISDRAIRRVDEKLQCFLYEKYVCVLRESTSISTKKLFECVEMTGSHFPVIYKARFASL